MHVIQMEGLPNTQTSCHLRHVQLGICSFAASASTHHNEVRHVVVHSASKPHNALHMTNMLLLTTHT